ncbi:hypothetical protein HYU40_04330 [Candidatus Woesearchaeota archaeon]|nr:hypothetical protein [Candidatus Woesearchaeota archaeon]
MFGEKKERVKEGVTLSLNCTRLSKHDRYVEELCTKIKDNYDSISKHVTVRAKKRMLAEVDVLAKKGDDVDLYEVKCSPRITKARRQLRKLSKYLGGAMNITNYYFYCGSSHSIMTILLE